MKVRPNPFFRHAFAVLSFACVSLQAAPLYWDGTGAWPTGTWGTDDFWSASSSGGSPGAWADGSNAVFSAGTSASGSYTVTLGSSISAVTLAVEEGSPTLSAASATTVTLTGTGTFSTPTLAPSAGATLTVGNNVKLDMTGADAQYIQGAGTINIDNGGTVSAASTATQLVINGSTVNVNTGGTLSQLSSASGSRFYVGPGGTASKLVVSGGTVTINGADGLFFGNNASSKGTIELNSGTLTTKKIQKGTNATATGDFFFNGGTLQAGAASTSFWANSANITAKVKSGGGTIDTNGYNITISQNLLTDTVSTGGELIKTGTGQLILSGTNTFTGGFDLSQGSVLVGGSSTTSLTSVTNGSLGAGNLTLRGGTVLASTSATSRMIAAPQINLLGDMTIGFTGLGRIQVAGVWDLGNGSRSVTLGKASTDWASGNEVLTFFAQSGFYTPTVQNGSLTLRTDSGTSATPSIARFNTTSFVNNSALTLADGVAVSSGNGNFFNSGTNAPALTLNVAATKGGGVLQMGDGTNLGAAVMRNAEVYSLAGGGTVSSSNTTGTVTTGTLTISNGNGADFSGTITETGGTGKIALTKSGAGTQTLSGTSNYTGATAVTAGKLIVNGNISTSSLTTVSGTGTLGGSGTVGATTISSGGTLAPGNSIDSLGITGALTLSAGSFSLFEINTAGDISDLAIVSGLLTFGGTLNVNNVGASLVNGDTFNLFDWGSTSGTFATVNLPGLAGGLSWDSSNLYTNGTITVIPEPNSAALLGGLGALLLLRRRRA